MPPVFQLPLFLDLERITCVEMMRLVHATVREIRFTNKSLFFPGLKGPVRGLLTESFYEPLPNQRIWISSRTECVAQCLTLYHEALHIQRSLVEDGVHDRDRAEETYIDTCASRFIRENQRFAWHFFWDVWRSQLTGSRPVIEKFLSLADLYDGLHHLPATKT